MSDTANSSRIFSPLRMGPADHALGSLMEKKQPFRVYSAQYNPNLKEMGSKDRFQKVWQMDRFGPLQGTRQLSKFLEVPQICIQTNQIPCG